jgi:alkanesulfonate monooxygenase SsuD/methylene tetrahydromethanopterin reductase-like flavin-dependent oxidoreductase (luciferase family)
MAASLDRLSGGRFVLGIGAGWSRQEFAALGLPFERRGTMTDDYLRAIRALWTQDVAAHRGPFTSFAGVHTAPRPTRVGQPPIWVGGNSDAGIRRAVRLGDAWHPLRFTMPWLRTALVRLKSAADADGRDIPGLAPRIALRLTAAPVVDDGRLAGVGTIAQVCDDIEELRTLGATAIVFDPYAGEPEETRRPDVAWRALATVAAELPDLVGRDPTER